VSDEDSFSDEHEASLIKQLDDAALRKVFAGLVTGRTEAG